VTEVVDAAYRSKYPPEAIALVNHPAARAATLKLIAAS
jgi:hypothetical protein